jgi:hypothetical protein
LVKTQHYWLPSFFKHYWTWLMSVLY